LKVAWFTSVTGEGKAVKYSRWVLDAIAQLAEPCLCCTDPPRCFPPAVPVVDLGAYPEALWDLGPIDAVFYVLGNGHRQNAWTFEMARTHPGIVILLEETLHRFFVDYYLQHLRRPDLYITRMAEHYGVEGLSAAHRALGLSFDPAGVRVPDRDLCRYTFIEEALRSASGAVVHSRRHGAHVRRVWNGPVHETWPPGSAETGSAGYPGGALKYAERLLGFAEQHSFHGAVDYFAESASWAVAQRIAAQVGHTLAGLGADPRSAGIEAVIAETARLLSPPPG
jgi:hypothetical protein